MDGLKFAIKKVPARTVVGIARRTSNAEAADTIPGCWQEFLTTNAVARIPHRVNPPVMYALYTDYESDWTKPYTYILGCGVTRAEKVPEGMESRTIPPQTYAVWANIWSSDLPRTYTFDFEVYDKRFTRPQAKEADVYIAVDPERLEKTG